MAKIHHSPIWWTDGDIKGPKWTPLCHCFAPPQHV